ADQPHRPGIRDRGGARIPARGTLELVASRKRSMRATRIIPLLAAILLPTWALAQTTTGTVRGTVTDDSGAVIPGATITVTNKGTGVPRETISDESGTYVVSNLAAGPYEVKAELQRFQTQIQTVTVLTGAAANADFKLKVGAASEVIQVTGSTAQVNLTE